MRRINPTIVAFTLFLCIFGHSFRVLTVAEEKPADALTAANLQIKTGPEDESSTGGRNLLLEIQRAAAPLLAEMAAKHGYGLEPEQALRRISPPFPEIRSTYYKVGHPWQAKQIKQPANAMTFFWDGEKLTQWGMIFGNGYRLTDVIDNALKIKPPDIEGHEDFLERRLEGDWVIRSGITEEQLLKELQTILQKEFNLPARLMFAKRVRTVFVARGKYQYVPVVRDENGKAAVKTQNEPFDQIEIYGAKLGDPALGGGGSGEFKDFLAWTGRWIQVSIINEVTESPAKEISWHDNHPEDGNSEANHDPERVLKNISDQTGLTFTKELRVVRRLLVEPLE